MTPIAQIRKKFRKKRRKKGRKKEWQKRDRFCPDCLMYPSSTSVPFILCGRGLARTLPFKTLSETLWVMYLSTYSNSPLCSSHWKSVVVSSSYIAILELREVGQEASSNKLLFVPLLESSCTWLHQCFTQSTALLLLAPFSLHPRWNRVQFCSSPTKNTWKHCQVYLLCIYLPCS